MRKIKKLLMTFGLAGALAVGVGASVATLNHSEPIRANAAAGETYKKITAAPESWPGKYLIVNEANSVIFDGSLTDLDVSCNNKAVEISNNTITTTTENPNSYFEIEKDSSNKLYLKAASGKYIYRNATSNGITTSKGSLKDISFDKNGNVLIKSGKSTSDLYLKYNGQSGQERFRFFTSAQTSIQLYALQASVNPTKVTINALAKSELYVDETLQLSATVEPSNAAQIVTYAIDSAIPKVEGQTVASVSENGLVTALNPGSVSITATSADGSKKSESIKLTVLANEVAEFTLTNPEDLKPQYVGEAFNSDGLVFKAKRTVGELTVIPNSDIIFTPEVLALGTQNVTATFDNATYVIENVEALPNNKITFTKVNDVAQLNVGSKIIITNEDGTIAMSSNQKTDNRGKIDANTDPDQNTIVLAPADMNNSIGVFDLTSGHKEGTYGIYDPTRYGYLASASSKSNYLRTYSDLADNTSFSISISAGKATIQSASTTNNGLIRYNPSNNLFSCYKQSSSCSPVAIYAYTPASDALAEVAQTWAHNHLRMEDPDFSGDAAIGRLSCLDLYAVAKKNLIDLEKHYPGITQTVKADETMNKRFVKWAIANQDANPYDGVIFVSQTNMSLLGDNTNIVIAIVVISILSVSAIAMFAISKRRKATR